MALPKIATPTFTLELPSNGKAINYRPFLVKEEKLLLIAQEGGDENEIMNAIVQVLNDCCSDDSIDFSKHPTFDIEYYFLQLRSRSIGEHVDVSLPCKDCDDIIKFQINLLEDITIYKNEDHTNRLQLTDDVGVVMKYPTVRDTATIQKSDTNNIEQSFSVIINSIESIYDSASVYYAKETSREEMEDFLYGLPQTCFKKVTDFFETMPKLSYKKTHVCKNGHENDILLEGLAGFF
mgnify:CR=1 FL=1